MPVLTIYNHLQCWIKCSNLIIIYNFYFDYYQWNQPISVNKQWEFWQWCIFFFFFAWHFSTDFHYKCMFWVKSFVLYFMFFNIKLSTIMQNDRIFKMFTFFSINPYIQGFALILFHIDWYHCDWLAQMNDRGEDCVWGMFCFGIISVWAKQFLPSCLTPGFVPQTSIIKCIFTPSHKKLKTIIFLKYSFSSKNFLLLCKLRIVNKI